MISALTDAVPLRENALMSKAGRSIMWLVLSAVLLLTALSIYAAFLGSDKAKQFFNSAPLVVFWFAIAVLFIAGFLVYDKLIRQPSSLLIHAGCLFIIIGAMFSSDAGHRFAKRFFNIDKIPSGYMPISEGQSENRIIDVNNNILGTLPFSIKLIDFRVEYYDGDKEQVQKLNITSINGKTVNIPAITGQEISLEKPRGALKITRTFVNFKIDKIGEKMVASDQPGPQQNPAVEVEFESSDGKKFSGFIFRNIAGFRQPVEGLHIAYAPQLPQMPKDFFSDITIIKDGNEAARKTIEVNHPLHFEGYHFYQYGFDEVAGRYTILSITSDSGLLTVFSGYWLLCIGLIWRLWLIPAIKYFKFFRHQYGRNKKDKKAVPNGN